MGERPHTDSPFTRGAKGWDLHIPAGREVTWGHAWDPQRGYRVFIAFKDSCGRNTISAEGARAYACERLNPDQPDQARLAAALMKMADQVDRLNAGWEAAGRPAAPLADAPAGRA